MKVCFNHPDLEYIYILLSSQEKQIFKCPQCIIDEEISNTKQLIMINSIIKSDETSLFINWPPIESSQIMQSIINLRKKYAEDSNFIGLRRSISDEILKLKQDVITMLNEKEKALHQLIDTNIQHLRQFEKQYNLHAEKETLKNLISNCTSNGLSNQKQLSEFILKKQLQMKQVTHDLQNLLPYQLIEFDDKRMLQACINIKQGIQNQIDQVEEKIFKQQQLIKKHSQSELQHKESKHHDNCCQDNNFKNNTIGSMDAILSLFSGKDDSSQINVSHNLQEQSKQCQMQCSVKNPKYQINSDQIPDVIFDQQVSSDQALLTIKKDLSQPQSLQSNECRETKQIQDLTKNSIQIENNLFQSLQIQKSLKGGASTDIEISQNEQGYPSIKYILSGYDHSQCFLDKILEVNKKYIVRININLKDPYNDQVMIGLIKKQNVNQIYIHQEKICFGNSSFSSTKKVEKGQLITSNEIWPYVKEVELQIHIQSGKFLVTDYPGYNHINSLQNSNQLASEANQTNEWVLGFFFFTGIEQINNTLTITYFAED